MNIFERSSRLKLRFLSKRGLISDQEAWDLSLEDLNEIAVSVDAEIKATSTVSFISDAPDVSSELKLKLDILKHIIEAKKTYASAVVKQQETLALKAKLQSALDRKKDAALEGMSEEELRAALAEL